jgi:hypothetical protein
MYLIVFQSIPLYMFTIVCHVLQVFNNKTIKAFNSSVKLIMLVAQLFINNAT